ncbi:MAG: hypothetical protein WAO55_16345 [Candidatus Manganitrophaceae bacterium]
MLSKKSQNGFSGNRVVVFAMAVVMMAFLWNPADAALQRRTGHLHFSYTGATSCPVGMVLLNHINVQTPSIEYQLPCVPPTGGTVPFIAPWGAVVETNTTPDTVMADTLITITNSDMANPLQVTITLVDASGAIEPGCSTTLTLPPHGTRLRSGRTLFAGCPSYLLP